MTVGELYVDARCQRRVAPRDFGFSALGLLEAVGRADALLTGLARATPVAARALTQVLACGTHDTWSRRWRECS